MAEIKLRQIAERLGVSRSTVSYALRNSPGCSDATRKRVLEIAEELGWRPDADLNLKMAAVRMVTVRKRSPALAVILNMGSAQLSKNNAPALQLDGIRNRGRELGFKLDEFNLVDTPLPARRLRAILAARGIQGIVFLATVTPPLPLDYLKIGIDFTCAVSGIRYPSLPFHVTIPDLLAAGRSSILEILEMGYKRPGVIISRTVDEPLSWGFSGGAYTGLLAVSEGNRLPILFVEQDEPLESMIRWVADHRPDAILTLDAPRTGEMIAVAREQGMTVDAFSYDWYPEQDVLGGIDLMQRDVGRAAVDLVVDQLANGESGLPLVQRCVNIEGIWATRENYFESHFVEAKSVGA